jgi:hypothetical protein
VVLTVPAEKEPIDDLVGALANPGSSPTPPPSADPLDDLAGAVSKINSSHGPNLSPAMVAVNRSGSGFATAGFVCSLLGLLCCGSMIFSILGIIFSCVARSQMSPIYNRQGCKTAKAGLIMGIIGIILGIIACVIYACGSHHR